jgi:hypothetical protein
MPCGVPALDGGHVILCLDNAFYGGLLCGAPKLLSCVGSALALLRLKPLHGPAHRRQHEHVRASREDGTGAEHSQRQPSHTPAHRPRCSPLGVVG